MTRHRSHHACGFMLVMTLVLLAIVGTAAVAMARRSAAQATAAIQAENDLQRVWGMRSAMTLLAGSAEQVIEAAQAGQDQPIRHVHFQVTLSRMPLRILLTDEQARPNVDALADHLGTGQAQSRIMRLMREEQASFDEMIPVRLRPLERTTLALAGQDVASRAWPRFASYSAVFEKQDLAVIMGLTGVSEAGQAITCWGDGRLRWSRATPQAIAAVCEDLIGLHHIQTLIHLRQEQPGLGSQEAVGRLNLPHQLQDRLRGRFVDQSHCHAIILSLTQGSRRHTVMRVEEIRQDGSLAHHSYEQSWP